MIISVVIAVVVAAGIYIVVHRVIANKAISMITSDAQKTTDLAMKHAIKIVAQEKYIQLSELELSSETVANVWGQGVTAFEYEFQLGEVSPDFNRIKWELNGELQNYAIKNSIKSFANVSRIFVVTDIWTYLDRLHIDVAYVINESTAEYIKDLDKLNQ